MNRDTILVVACVLRLASVVQAFTPSPGCRPLIETNQRPAVTEARPAVSLIAGGGMQGRGMAAAPAQAMRPSRLAASASSSGASSAAEKASEVIGSLFGGKGGAEFWEWRKKAQMDGKAMMKSELTYGEFDLELFNKLVLLSEPQPGEVFCDIGSGCGRLVIFAALTHASLGICKGIEIMPELHAAAEAGLAAARGMGGDVREMVGADRVSLTLGDVYEEPSFLHDVGVCFCYSTAYSSIGSQLTSLSACLGCNLKVGARVITTDKELASDGPWAFELLHKVEGRNSDVGRSTGFLWRVSKSPLG